MLTNHVLTVGADVTSTAHFCPAGCPTGWPHGKPCHRYLLTRTWDNQAPVFCFIGMNPSAANQDVDDATVRRVSLLARRRGYGALWVVNTFGLRATNPRLLRTVSNPIGPENDRAILAAIDRADMVLAAWGCIPPERDRAVRALLQSASTVAERVVCYGRTKQGFPKHPLYQQADPTLVPFLG